MENIYHWIGFVVFWLVAIISNVIVFSYLIKAIIDGLGSRYEELWIIVEYARNRRLYNEWKKSKSPSNSTLTQQ